MRPIALTTVVALELLLLGACGQTTPDTSPTETSASPAPNPITAESPVETPAVVAHETPVSSAPTSTPAADKPASRIPSRLQALGTEPFWNVRIDGARLVYTTPEDQKGQMITAARDDTSVASTWTGQLAGKPVEVSIVPEKCSDGMSDTEYPFSAWLKLGGTMRHGCARELR
jgi:uncharacterized membrane protein